MRKLFVLAGVALTALLVLSSPAAASSTTCNSTLTGVTIPDDLVVPEDASCTIVDSTVVDDVRVGRNAFFTATNSDIGDDVEAKNAQGILLELGSTVGDDIRTSRTVQVFLFDSSAGGDIEVRKSASQEQPAQVNICGMTVGDDILVKDSANDILVGDPLAVGCAGNTVGGDIEVERNFVDVELIVRGNTVADDLEVNHNRGPAEKNVENNTGGDELECWGNEEPFNASGNTGWNETEGQCEIPPTECNSGDTPVVVTAEGDLIVPENGVCVITGSTVGGDVYVGKNAYFEAAGSQIAGDVKARWSAGVYLHSQTTVGGGVETKGSFTLDVFDSSVVDDIEVSRSVALHICGNTVGDDIEVTSSGPEVQVGDPVNACGANTVGDDIEVKGNNTSDFGYLIVRGNTVTDDLEVTHNSGSAVDKFVQDNTGGDKLECRGNELPFTGAPNAGFARVAGDQCALI